ncbi:MAG: tryptophanase [Candidatus Cloacimonetes bacterium]|jgi:tryptophanase|nr:tryptophanase [Candidatus Cloacimonadota bacterium]MCK9334307.1 tryptophanase [Candidatus Cloacimonadota bacterium]MDD2544420.1 tryptophanase [Candidatus Cloacimonadota bacterium]MDD4667539.1 tryptophanase [Candidatus Cloacimonadota bacterium]MDY0337907.1 tryptophanase [Candidatus Cloacimonadaceae bacterium]
MSKMPYAEPWRVKMVEPLKMLSREERVAKIKAASFNLFNLVAEDVFIDLLTDSGTGAMSDHQWSALMMGDESYAGSKSFLAMKETITELMGFPYVLPTHQGRAAENVLFSATIKQGDIIPGNAHFDTTKGHIEFRKATAVDCTIEVPEAISKNHPFKGNIDIDKLEACIAQYGKEKIPMVIHTVTCNTGGGQPVSMQNLREVAAVCKKHGIPLVFDSARFAENAYFIKTREDGYQNKSIKEVVKEMFSYADGMTMSAKKDAIVNIGGFIALRDEKVYQACCTFGIIFEGFVTYGGMSGRDMAALAAGLRESTEYDYLHARISQVEYLGKLITDLGIPIVEPAGGHAIYVDAKAFFPQIPQTHYPAQVLGVALYEEAGVRGVEIGTVLADRDPISREERPPKLELLRLAIPRRVYTNNHMQIVAWGLQQIWEKRESYRGLKITWEAPIMRHFTALFERL